MTLETLGAAINAYKGDSPLTGDRFNVMRTQKFAGEDVWLFCSDVFGPYPPSPTGLFSTDDGAADIAGEFRWSLEEPADGGGTATVGPYIETYAKACRLIGMAMVGDGRKGQKSFQAAGEQLDYLSIELLMLYLTRLSPSAKAMLDQLPGDVTRNLDNDFAFVSAGSSERIALTEVVDAWGRPLRYRSARRNDFANAMAVEGYIWELRSAGPDGRFDNSFSDPNRGNDIVLTGP
jgi:hypothetical protein